MARHIDRLPHAMRHYRFFAFVDAVVTLALFVPVNAAMVLTLTNLQANGPVPGVVAFAALAASTAACLGLGLPLGLFLTCAGYQTLSWNRDLTAADAAFGRRVFGLLLVQTTRLAGLVCAGMVLLALWPDEASVAVRGPPPSIGLGNRIAVPLAAAVFNGLVFWRYYGRERSSRTGGPADRG